uniref:Uncharacterized protein n=1 Tax=Anguilla anguilla TaxID=7936 RepID=A0A0E9RZH1_ANGAN
MCCSYSMHACLVFTLIFSVSTVYQMLLLTEMDWLAIYYLI